MQKQHDPILLVAVVAVGVWALLRPIVVWAVALLITVALAIGHHRHGPQPAPQPPRLAVEPKALPVAAPPISHPLADLEDELMALPATRLREVAGIRSKRLRKVALVEVALAMPV
jgi:hypothetical protein